MKARLTSRFVLLASAILLASCGGDSGSSSTPTPTPTPATIPSPPPTSKVVLGYYVAYDSLTSYYSLTTYHGFLNAVSATGFIVRSDGGIDAGRPDALITFAAEHGIETYACVTNNNGSWNATLAHSAIVTNRTQTVQSLVAVARGGGFTGINIDLEGLWRGGDIDQDREAYSAFIAELGPALHSFNLKLVISVPAKEADDRDEDWSYPFDYAAIAPHADLVQLMTYDQHGWWGEPGPVAGLDWAERCVVFAKGQIPPAKLLVGLPAYGYDWDLDYPAANDDISWNAIPTLLSSTGATVQFDPPSASPFITYTDSNGHRHESWFENAQSIAAKVALVNRHGLAGISMWRLGAEDLDFWNATRVGLD